MWSTQVSSMFIATLMATSAQAQTKIKFMPLGDSITEITCWRTTVWGNLVNAGLASRIDFVGSMSNNPQNCQGASGWDQNHEGHSGYQSVNIANNNLAGWLNNAKPDIVHFMLGTNDIVSGGKDATTILSSYTKMVGLMRSSNSRMRIIVSKPTPIGFGNYPALANLNNNINSWASGLSTSQSPITVVDMNTGYPTSALRDGLHPNAAGDAIIASRLSPVLINQLQSAIGGTPATTTAVRTTTRAAQTTTQGLNPNTTSRASSGSGAPAWGQCGGTGWTGPTTCAQGTCTVSNAWYSQCIP